MRDMTWEEKRDALEALCGSLDIGANWDGLYYVSGGIEVSDMHFLTSVKGAGFSPQAAVEDLWERVANLSPDEHVYVSTARSSAGAGGRFRWNGFMWKELRLVDGKYV